MFSSLLVVWSGSLCTKVQTKVWRGFHEIFRIRRTEGCRASVRLFYAWQNCLKEASGGLRCRGPSYLVCFCHKSQVAVKYILVCPYPIDIDLYVYNQSTNHPTEQFLINPTNTGYIIITTLVVTVPTDVLSADRERVCTKRKRIIQKIMAFSSTLPNGIAARTYTPVQK